MNQQLDLRYSHFDCSRIFRDVRSKPLPEIEQEQCYFLGFRIAIAHGYRYHHALILADDHDSLIKGVKGEYKAIQERSKAIQERSSESLSNIALVFMRNMAMQDHEMNMTIVNSNIQAETEKILNKRDDNQFTVLGLQEDVVRLMSINASDALNAIQLARSQSDKLLEVCQAHPVTKEFDVLFKLAAHRIKCLIGFTPAEDSLVH